MEASASAPYGFLRTAAGTLTEIYVCRGGARVIRRSLSTERPPTVTHAGLVAGTAGLHQINVVVPNVAMSAGQTFDDSVGVIVRANGVTLPVSPSPAFLTLPVELQ